MQHFVGWYINDCPPTGRYHQFETFCMFPLLMDVFKLITSHKNKYIHSYCKCIFFTITYVLFQVSVAQITALKIMVNQ